jgi:peptide/nickel transport system substrate-binding protein
MTRRLLVTVLAAAAVIAAGAVSRSDAAAGAHSATIPLLREGELTGTTTLDTAKNQGARGVAQQGLETLMHFSPQGRVIPWLAQSVTQPSPELYIYHLHHGVKFWDGTELTSADVVYSLEHQGAPASQVAFGYEAVKSIVAKNRYTVVVTLKHPAPDWRLNSAEDTGLIFEKKFAEAHKGTMGNPGVLIMGTGPWKFDSLDPTSGAELSANPHWWHGAVAIQHISDKFFADEQSQALAFRAGEIDVVTLIGDPKGFAAAAKTKLLPVPSCSEAFLSMNVKVAPWSDVHVRRAAAYAINRAAVLKAHGGYASPANTVILPSMLSSVASKSQIRALLASLPQYPYSIAKAKAELAKSAYPKGFSATIETVSDTAYTTIAQAVAGQLAKIGIKVKINAVSSGKWIADIGGPALKRPTQISTSFGCTGPDPSSFDSILHSKDTLPGQYNVADYAVPAVDKLIEAGETESDPAKRLPIYKQLLTRLQTDLPYIVLYSPNLVYALSSKFTWPGLTTWSVFSGDWPLGIRAK